MLVCIDGKMSPRLHRPPDQHCLQRVPILRNQTAVVGEHETEMNGYQTVSSALPQGYGMWKV